MACVVMGVRPIPFQITPSNCGRTSRPARCGDPRGRTVSKDFGGVRTSFPFHHIIAIVPNDSRARANQGAAMVEMEVKQKPIEGVSMVYTFEKANANAPSKR